MDYFSDIHDIVQVDRNYGLARGWLTSVVRETMPGYWELVRSWWTPSSS